MNTEEIFNASLQTSEEISKLDNWMIELSRPFLKGKVFELSSGTGRLSSLLVSEGFKVQLSDPLKSNRDTLRKRFSNNSNIIAVQTIDFLIPDFKQLYSDICEQFDTVVALNFAEHGLYENQTLQNAKHLLRQLGRLIVALPSSAAVLDGHELSVTELRNYNMTSMLNFFKGFEIMKTGFLNFKASNSAYSTITPILVVIARKI